MIVYKELIYMPMRPSWKYGVSKEELEKAETKMFTNYLQARQKKFFLQLNFHQLFILAGNI